ncbi:MAG: AsmA family protein, partial [Alphaproteobacteria bacterium]
LAESMGTTGNIVGLLNDAGSLSASGSVAFRGQNLDLSNLNADLKTPSGNLVYSGDAKDLMRSPQLQGRFNANTPSVVRMVSLLAPGIMIDIDAFQTALSGSAQAASEIYFADGSLRLDGLTSSIKGPSIDAGFNGRISTNATSGAVEARGDLRSDVASAKVLARAFGVELPGGPDVYQRTSVNGQVSYEANRIRIQNAEIALDDIRSGLNLDANFAGAKPSIAIGFAADNIDLNKYISGETHEQVAARESQVQEQRTLESSWSNEPIDVSVLRTFDLDLTAVVNGLKYGGYEFGHTEATATVNNGQAEINLPDTSIFGGQTGANVKINAQNQTPSFALRGNLNGVRAKAALESLLRIDRVDGIANLALDVQSIGGSEAQLMQNLSGSARADIDEGALLGFDIRKTVANVRQGILTPVKGDNEKTTFSTASLGFNINQGIAETNDIKFWSPVLKVTGGGQMDLPNRQMRMELPVELGVFRQDGTAETKTLTLPLQVVGSWVDPNVRLNTDALLQSFLQNPDGFLGLLPKGLGVDNLFKDGQNVQQVINQQRDKIEQKAQEELQRIQQQAQDKLQEEAARAAQKLADELGGQLGGQIGEQLNQQITQGLGGNVGEQGQGVVNNILQNPNVQQQLEQEAGNLLNNLFGN